MNDTQFNALLTLTIKIVFLNILYLMFPFFSLIFGYAYSEVTFFEFLILPFILYCYITRTIKVYKYGLPFLKKKLLNFEVIIFCFTYIVSFILGFFASKNEDVSTGVCSYAYPMSGVIIVFLVAIDLIELGLIAYNNRKILLAIKEETKRRNTKNT